MEPYENILERMRSVYRELSGAEPEDVSDTGLRLRVLAGETARLQAAVDWLRRQAFPQTATGEELDLHGSQRGVVRKGAARAQGTITLARYLPLSFDLVIPKGTVCAAAGEEALEYETTEDVVLAAGELSVDAAARAVTGGPEGNAAAGCVNTLVSVPNGIQYAVNRAAFTGGRDRESDEKYRARVLAAYGRTVQCGNADYYEKLALETEGVAQAQATPRANGAGTVAVSIWGEAGAPAEDVVRAVEEKLRGLREIGAAVTVSAAVPKAVNMTAQVKLAVGADAQRAVEDGEKAMRLWFAKLKIGEPVYLSQISQALMNAIPAEKVAFPVSVSDTVGEAGKICVPGTLKVVVL